MRKGVSSIDHSLMRGMPDPKPGELRAGSYFVKEVPGVQRRGRPEGQLHRRWQMKCGICGSKFEINVSQINHAQRKGETRHCSNRHLHTGVKIGDRFLKTVVIDWEPPSDEVVDDRWTCKMQCDCGEIHYARPDQLKKGDIKSCGCRRAELSREALTTHGLSGTHAYSMWCNSKQRATKEGLPFNLEPKDCIPPEACPVLGIAFDFSEKGDRNDESPSLDKFIPELGYVKGNIAVISWKANRMKSNGTPEEWRRIAAWATAEELKRSSAKAEAGDAKAPE